VDPAREWEMAGLAELVVEIEIVKVCAGVKRVDGDATDRRVGRLLFQETTCHSVRSKMSIVGRGKRRLLPEQQIIRGGAIVGLAVQSAGVIGEHFAGFAITSKTDPIRDLHFSD
jgi:hypothetical protein